MNQLSSVAAHSSLLLGTAFSSSALGRQLYFHLRCWLEGYGPPFRPMLHPCPTQLSRQRRHNVAHGQSGATTAMCGAGRVEPRSKKNMPYYSKIYRSPHHITPQRGQLHRAQMLSPAVRVCRRPLCVRCLLRVCCLLCGVAGSASVICCNPLLMLLLC